MKWESHDFTVATHFLPAIINHDFGGLSTEDIDQVDAFLDNEKYTGVNGHWAETKPESEGFFGRCDVSGQKAHVYMLSFVFPVN